MTTLGSTPAPAPPPDPGSAPLSPAASELVPLCERLLAELRGEVGRADSKASVLVAALGMTAGVFSGLLAGRDWTPAELSATGTALWWAGTAALGLSLFALLLAVLPRYSSDGWTPGRPLSYFGDIQQAVRLGRLETALGDTRRDPTTGLTAALTEMSRIAARKHQWIRTGLIAFCTGTVLLPASLLIG
ncbi:Pycsar system effector family protein [Streptomyces sp. NPDC005760]|uniref:Pycsar system effector family protein n=1 Tax=Streptomyces sp. NPDC005760 TaxID=3156718 RepID=UPI0034059517